MKIKLPERELWKIFDGAKDKFMAGHNQAIPSELYALYCYLNALSDYLGQNGIQITFEMPDKQYVEPIEDYDSFQDMSLEPSDSTKIPK